jgi:type I restriction enzyme S subunit
VTFLKGNEVAWGSTEYIVMRPKRGFHPFFAYVLARNSDFREYAEGCLAGSSGRQRIDLEHQAVFPFSKQGVILARSVSSLMNFVPDLNSLSYQLSGLKVRVLSWI